MATMQRDEFKDRQDVGEHRNRGAVYLPAGLTRQFLTYVTAPEHHSLASHRGPLHDGSRSDDHACTLPSLPESLDAKYRRLGIYKALYTQ